MILDGSGGTPEAAESKKKVWRGNGRTSVRPLRNHLTLQEGECFEDLHNLADTPSREEEEAEYPEDDAFIPHTEVKEVVWKTLSGKTPVVDLPMSSFSSLSVCPGKEGSEPRGEAFDLPANLIS